MQGKKTGGRTKGVPNKVTTEVRALFAGIVERNASKVEEWINKVAETDPGRAADLFFKLSEFHLPKLARTELANSDTGELLVRVVRG